MRRGERTVDLGAKMLRDEHLATLVEISKPHGFGALGCARERFRYDGCRVHEAPVQAVAQALDARQEASLQRARERLGVRGREGRRS